MTPVGPSGQATTLFAREGLLDLLAHAEHGVEVVHRVLGDEAEPIWRSPPLLRCQVGRCRASSIFPPANCRCRAAGR